jgi:hypothetical protein
MRQHFPDVAEISIWPFDKAPDPVRRIAGGIFEWVALLPASPVSNEVERLFWRWDSQDHPVVRRILPNGSVVLAGSYPTAETMISTGMLASNRNPAITLVKHPRTGDR